MAEVLDGPWADYARAQVAARRAWHRDERDMTPESVLDHVLARVAAGMPVDGTDVIRVRCSAARRERARTALLLRHAAPYEDDLRHRAAMDPARTAVVADALRRIGRRDATMLVLDARGYGSAEVAAIVGIGADTVRQRLSRRRAALVAGSANV